MSNIVIEIFNEPANLIFVIARLLREAREELATQKDAKSHFFKVIHVERI